MCIYICINTCIFIYIHSMYNVYAREFLYVGRQLMFLRDTRSFILNALFARQKRVWRIKFQGQEFLSFQTFYDILEKLSSIEVAVLKSWNTSICRHHGNLILNFPSGNPSNITALYHIEGFKGGHTLAHYFTERG